MNGMVYRLIAINSLDLHPDMNLIQRRLEQMREEGIRAIQQHIGEDVRRLKRTNIIVCVGRKVQYRKGLDFTSARQFYPVGDI